MRSTNEERISACTRAASGRKEAVTLTALNLRVAQVFTGRTRTERRLARTTARWRVEMAQNQTRVEAINKAVGDSLAAMRAERQFRLEA